MSLSPKALEVLKALFAENSSLQLPVAVASEVMEIRSWVTNQLDTQLIND